MKQEQKNYFKISKKDFTLKLFLQKRMVSHSVSQQMEMFLIKNHLINIFTMLLNLFMEFQLKQK